MQVTYSRKIGSVDLLYVTSAMKICSIAQDKGLWEEGLAGSWPHGWLKGHQAMNYLRPSASWVENRLYALPFEDKHPVYIPGSPSAYL